MIRAGHDVAAGAAQARWTAGLALLSIRFVQGFVYWGGGSRRFIYAPGKLDAWGGHPWMANKLQTAMPGIPAFRKTTAESNFLLRCYRTPEYR